MPEAEACARRAAELGPDLSEPLVSLGLIKSVSHWDWNGGGADFQRATELNPGASTPHYLYAVVNLATRGLWDRALSEMHAALALDPVSPLLRRDLGLIHYLQRDYREAETQLQAAEELDARFTGHLFWLARTLTEAQRFEEALAALDRRRQQSPANPRVEAVRCVTLARMGRHGSAEQCLSDLEALSIHRPVSPLSLALAHIGLAHVDTALECLLRAAAERSAAMYQIAVDPIFDPLRSDPRFAALLARMNLPVLAAAAS